MRDTSNAVRVIFANAQDRPTSSKLRKVDFLCGLVDGNSMRSFPQDIVAKLMELSRFFVEKRDSPLTGNEQHMSGVIDQDNIRAACQARFLGVKRNHFHCAQIDPEQ